MRKYVLMTILLFVAGAKFSFSQIGDKKPKAEVDSLLRILPSLKGIARVDALNMISDRYHSYGFPSLQAEVDAETPLNDEAYALAKKLGYKKGIAYALLNMGNTEDERDNMGGNEVAYRKAIEYLNEAIDVARTIADNYIIAEAYSLHAWLEEKRNNMGVHSDLMNKSIAACEQAGNENRSIYENYAYNAGCKGNENWLGSKYQQFGRALTGEKGKEDSVRLLFNKGIEYYKRGGDLPGLGNAYFWFRRAQASFKDFEGAIESTKKLIAICQELGKEEDVLREYNWICNNYLIRGNFETGIEYAKKNIQLAEELAKRKPADSLVGWFRSVRAQPFLLMGQFHAIAGDYATALELLHKAKSYYVTDTSLIDGRDRWYLDAWMMTLGDVHRQMGNFDSSSYYLTPFITMPDRNSVSNGLTYLMNLYVDMKQYDKAIAMINGTLQGKKIKILRNGYALTTAASAYFAKKEYQTALKLAREGLQMLRDNDNKIKMIDNYALLSDIFYVLKRHDSAYYYQKQYSQLKDTLLNRQLYFRLSNYKKEAEEERKTGQINLLNKDNQIKNQQLKQQALLKNFLLFGLLALLLITIFIYRNLTLKRKNEKLKAGQIQSQLQQKATDLEMQALRAQMNPHFIFNCLSSINRFILKNETETASDYLTRFSRLIRMVLINSQKTFISLEDEVEMLKLYLDMERLRFKKSFDYNITFSNTVDTGSTQLPPLLLQPFCENAIWHGLMHKEGQGRLDITLSMEGNFLNCIITDNGIGRQKAAELKARSGEERKSLGLKITTERLALLNHEKGPHTFYEIEDLKDEKGAATGTKVILKISSKEPIQETA